MNTTTEKPDQSDETHIESERLAFSILRYVGDEPGISGRLRVARIVGGFPIIGVAGERVETEKWDALVEWPLGQIVELIDALLAGRLIAQTIGARPTLVLTRGGHRALDQLEKDAAS